MATLYTKYDSFAAFIQSLIALCYLPYEELMSAMTELENFDFGKDIPAEDLEQILKCQGVLIRYTYDQWIEGDFHPSKWNFWLHARNNTNNRFIDF